MIELSPPPASPPFRQGRRCEKSVPVDPRSAVPLPDTTPPPPSLRRGRSWGAAAGLSTSVHNAAGAGRSQPPKEAILTPVCTS